jgi:hypothetical protein
MLLSDGIVEVVGSIPSSSTIIQKQRPGAHALGFLFNCIAGQVIEANIT